MNLYRRLGNIILLTVFYYILLYYGLPMIPINGDILYNLS